VTGGEHLNAAGRHQRLVKPVAVVAAVTGQARRKVGEEPGIDGRGDEVRFIR
jgi:hypothetical protein